MDAMRRISRFGSSLAAVVLASAVWSQAQDQPTEKPPAEEPQEEAQAPKLHWNELSFGYSGLTRSGNRRKSRQFATSPGGFVVRELKLTSPKDEDGHFARFVLRGFPLEDQVAEGVATFDEGRARIHLAFDDGEFFDSTPFPIDASRQRSTKAGLQYTFNRDLGAFIDYRTRARKLDYEPPTEGHRDRTTSIAGGIQGKAPGGYFSLTLGDDRYFDRTGVLPNTTLRRIDARYGLDFGGGPFALEGIYSRTNVEQAGRNNGHLITIGLDADWDAGPTTAFHASFRRDDINTPVTLNATTRQRFTTSARLLQRLGKASLQVGYRRREIERVRADRSFVDTPGWNLWDARLTARLNDSLRFSLKGSLSTMDGDAVATSTTDNRQLVWDDRARFEARIDGGNDRFSGHLGYAFRFQQNDGRNVEVSGHGLTLGGSLTLGERTNAFFEFAGDSQRATGLAQDGVVLDDFFPSTSVIALGFDHRFDERTSMSLALTHSYTNNANPLGLPDENVRQTFLTGTFRHRLTDSTQFDVILAPWRSTDRAFGQMDYRATTIGVFYTTKF